MDDQLLHALIDLGRSVRDRVRHALREESLRDRPPEARSDADVQYPIDALSEAELVAEVSARFQGCGGLRLLSEGLPAEGVEVFPGDEGHLLIVDPIDGTRGLMHDKRSAFFLAALAPLESPQRLSDVTHAAMVEIPGTRSVLSDLLAARRGDAVVGVTENLDTRARGDLRVEPSRATDLRHGFASIVRFFPGSATALGRLQDDLMRRLYPDDVEGRQDVFEDQYISNGGQLHALITGRDRFVADLRPLFKTAEGTRLRCAHPYDLAGALLAETAGVVLTSPGGAPLDVPLDLTTEVAWVGYASEELRRVVEPHLRAALVSLGIIPV